MLDTPTGAKTGPEPAIDARKRLGAEAAGRAAARLREAVRTIFGSACKAAWLSGSFVYEGERCGRSDIDVVVVLDAAVAAPADRDTLARIEAFVDAYLDVHARHRLDPDLDFPGEYVSPATIEQAIAWRGLALDGALSPGFPPVETPDYWLDRPDRWFHAWLSMTAFSRFLTGDRDYHGAVKLAAWKTIVRFVLLRAGGGPTSEEQLVPALAQFGMKPSYRAFWPREREWIRRALDELTAEGGISLADGRIQPEMTRLRAWARRMEARIRGDDGSQPLILPPDLRRRIAAHAARRWPALAVAEH